MSSKHKVLERYVKFLFYYHPAALRLLIEFIQCVSLKVQKLNSCIDSGCSKTGALSSTHSSVLTEELGSNFLMLSRLGGGKETIYHINSTGRLCEPFVLGFDHCCAQEGPWTLVGHQREVVEPGR